MEKTAVLRCRCCGAEEVITWGKGFYVTSEGKEEVYEQTLLGTSVSVERDISGFWVDKICRNCGKNIRESRYIEDTTDEYNVAWMNFPRVDIVNMCDECGSTEILSLYELITGDDGKIPCPKCRQGRLEINNIR